MKKKRNNSKNLVKNSWDLTNLKELKMAESIFKDQPVLYIGYKLIKNIFDSDTSSRQVEAATKLIKQGKESGVDALEITTKAVKGFKFNLPIDGCKIDTVLGADEQMTIKVKYK